MSAVQDLGRPSDAIPAAPKAHTAVARDGCERWRIDFLGGPVRLPVVPGIHGDGRP